MLSNFIYATKKSLFEAELSKGNILSEAVVFIADTKEIWNHGTYFGASEYDPAAFAEIQRAVAQLGTDKLDKTEASGLYALKTDVKTYSAGTGLSLDGNTFNHNDYVTSEGTAGTSNATSGNTIAIPYVTYNKQGHITGSGTHTHTITGFTNNEGTVTSITPGTGLTGTSSDAAITTTGTINLKTAGTGEIGGIKVASVGTAASGANTTVNANKFAVHVDSNGLGYVAIPQYSNNSGDITEVIAGSGLTGGASSGAATLNVGAGTGISVANDAVSVKLKNTTALSIDSAADTTTSGRVYPVAVDKSGYLAVNVPWKNDNTTQFTITASANDDDVVVLSGTNGTNATTYTASHAKTFGNTTAPYTAKYTSGNSTTSISGYGDSKTIKIPQITVDEYGHVRAGADESVVITMPSAQTIPDAIKNPKALTFGSKSYDGSSTQTITAADLGLDSALKFHGTSSTAITDGSTTQTVTLSNGSSHKAENGCVLFYGNKEFVWNGSSWEELGNEGDYKVKQTAVSSPATSGSTTEFIDTITQNANGVITATKKSIPASLKNPYSLTINNSAGTAQVSYDGSAAKSLTLTKAMVGLGNVDNTADANKSVASAGTATYATYLGNSTSDYSKSSLDTALAGKLNTSGGTLTGNLTIGDGVNSLFFRTNTTWASSVYHDTVSDEALIFLNKAKNANSTDGYTTSWIFAYGDPSNRPVWNTLTPAMQIKDNSVVINKLLGSKIKSSYNLDVNGSANATTLYENGTRVSLSGHNHDDRYYTETEIDNKLAGKQSVITNNVVYSGTPTSGRVAIFDATAGTIKASEYTIAKSVPSDAKFTDTNTTYTAGNGLTLSNTTFNVGAGVGISVTADAVKAKLRSETALTVDSAAATTTSGKVYPVSVDKSGYLSVNVPWTDTNTDTHYTTGINAGASGATSNTAQTNPYITVKDNSTYRSQIRLMGGGGTTVKSDASGNITISSTSSTECNFTNAYKTKLDGIATGATKVTESTVTDWGFAKTDDIPDSINEATVANWGFVKANNHTHDYLSTSGGNISGNLTVTGTVSSTGGFFHTSDETLKNFIGDVEVDFDKLAALPKKYFTWKDGDNSVQIGTSAQEVQKVYPEIVNTDDSGKLSVDYTKLSVIALSAIDKLNEKNKELEDRLHVIESLLSKLNIK